MSTQPQSPAPASTVATFAGQITSALSAFYKQQNNNLVATYNQAIAKAATLGVAAPAPPLLTIVNANLIAQYEAQANAGQQPTWSGILTQIPYLPTSNPPVASAPTVAIGAQLAPGIFEMTLSNHSQLANGTPFTVNGVNYQSVWTTPFGDEVAQVVE